MARKKPEPPDLPAGGRILDYAIPELPLRNNAKCAGPSSTRWTDKQGDEWFVQVAWGLIGGRAEPIAIMIESPTGRSVGADDVRQIPIGRLVGEMRARHGELIAWIANSVASLGPGAAPASTELAAAASTFKGPRSKTRTELERVAEVYQKAFLEHRRPKVAVAKEFGLSISGAGKRITGARKAGLLNPAQPGKAGL